jgi:hypothetical protein
LFDRRAKTLTEELQKAKKEAKEKDEQLQQWKHYVTLDKMAFDAQREKLLADINNQQYQVRDLEASKLEWTTVIQQWQAYTDELQKDISQKRSIIEQRDRQVHQQHEYIAFLTNLKESNKPNHC